MTKDVVHHGADRHLETATTWRIAVLGATAALLGSLVGALASVAVAFWGFERQEDTANRESREDAYVSFIKATKDAENRLRHDRDPSAALDAINTVSDVQALVILHGSTDAYGASADVVDELLVLLDVLVTEAEAGRNLLKVDLDSSALNEAQFAFDTVAREDLGIDD